MSDPWGTAFSFVRRDGAVESWRTKTRLASGEGDMEHTRLAHAQGGQPHGSMKGGARASSNRASYSGTGTVS